MISEHPRHPVSAKALLLSPDGQEVLIMKYLWPEVKDTYGLPGGHVEIGEDPDDTILRELAEELGIEAGPLKRQDFWMHETGKLVLLYSGLLDRDALLIPSQPHGEIGVWFPVDAIKNDRIHVGLYKPHILNLASRESRLGV